MLIQQQMVRLDTRNKRLMDSLKLIARNAFYRALRPFKTAYNNYRDDHELFRNLTQADGVLVELRATSRSLLAADGQLPAQAGEDRERTISGDQRDPPHNARRVRSTTAASPGRKNGASSCDRLLTKRQIL